MLNSSTRNKILNICIFLTVIGLLIYIFTSSKILEKFIGIMDEEDEECIIHPVVERIKRKIKKFLDERKEPWKGNLTKLNEPGNLIDKITICKGDSSYTIDKLKVYICTDDKKGNFTYDEHMLMHVTLHELAHVICPEVGHTPLWEKMFEELMEEAHAPTCSNQTPIYNKYLPLLEEYCGVGEDDTYDTSNPLK